VATLIGAEADEIVFTASGAEANNLAIKGVALSGQKKGKQIIVSRIEHHSVLNTARFLERLDYETSFLPVDKDGLIDPERLAKSISDDTLLVSIMHANNEIGTIQPIRELAAVCREKGVIFHTDAVATVGSIPVDVKELGVDLLSLSGAPLGAPKGVGALYFRKNIRLMPLIHGGIQEKGRRGGTENVPGIIGLGKAAELTLEALPRKMVHLQNLRDNLIASIEKRIVQVLLTGHRKKRLPGHVSFCIEAIEGEALIFRLNQQGVSANTGSACASKSLKTSPVLVALGVPPEIAQGSVVFTMDSSNTREEVEYVTEQLEQAADRLRALSPIWKAETAA
jgi:cysteine desulfurase